MVGRREQHRNAELVARRHLAPCGDKGGQRLLLDLAVLMRVGSRCAWWAAVGVGWAKCVKERSPCGRHLM
eukprot:7582619-Alexandrium_andersonii.AAC.1